MKKILLTLLALVSFLSANDTELQKAYAKEFAYLKAQKEMLEQRFSEVQKDNSAKLREAKQDISRLEKEVLAKNALSEKLSDELFRAQQNFQMLGDDTALVESVLMQATNTLKPHGIDVIVQKENYQEALKSIFVKSDALIRELSSLSTSQGQFYAKDGSEIEGTIIKLGNIASYGISPTLSGALVPAGEGKLKLYDAPEAKTSAEALAQKQTPSELNIFVYENLNKEIEDKQEKTIMSIINSGGIIGWVIVFLGLIGVLLAVLRAFFLMGASTTTDTLTKDTLQTLLKTGVDNTLEFLKNKRGSTARVLKATVRNLDRDREHIEDIVAESILHESSRLEKFGSVILVIAAVSPLLGLLGTVTGMIATFDIITEFGTGDPKLLSGGISIALVTTELGLIVAIPILMIGNLLSGWAEKVKDSMEHSALHLINEYNKQK
ncbi:MAG: MotA/TolQ/ExbB proton channel family protein [Sulfurimonas sp.]|jgi:biopolymer transport protein ExbB|nr:MotA/TolQ/ExbB proton channel family protein [Sulfurimonas sp.]